MMEETYPLRFYVDLSKGPTREAVDYNTVSFRKVRCSAACHRYVTAPLPPWKTQRVYADIFLAFLHCLK